MPYTIKQGRTTPFPCNPCSTVLMRVAFPCIFRHPNWHSIILRRPRMSTIYRVHEQRQRPGARFYRGNQPWGVESLTYPNHVSHRSPNIKLIVRPFSIPYQFKTHCYRIFLFLFGDTWKQIFSTHCFTLACGLCILLLFVFVFRCALQTCVL